MHDFQSESTLYSLNPVAVLTIFSLQKVSQRLMEDNHMQEEVPFLVIHVFTCEG